MNWKKAVSVMLVGIMALSMTACGDSGETSTDAASGGGSYRRIYGGCTARPLPAMISWWYGHSQTT